MVDKFNPILYSQTRKIGSLFITDCKLGKGSFSEVFLGYIENQSCPVAVKIFNLDNLKDEHKKKLFEREISNLSMVKHKNICTIKTLIQSKNNYYLATELCKKETLREFLKDKEITQPLVEKLCSEIFQAFKILYKKKIIHRDVKPENILVSENEELKISDFGFSKNILNMELKEMHTKLGTPFYACLEILIDQPFSSKCDVYSTGVVLYECIYKKHPYCAATSLSAIIRCLTQNPKPDFPEKPDIDPEIKSLLVKMLSAREENRFSWPEVFEFFDTYSEKKNKSNIQGKQWQLIIQKQNSISFLTEVCKQIEAIEQQEGFGKYTQIVMRIRLCLIILHAHQIKVLINEINAFSEMNKNISYKSLLQLLENDYQRLATFYPSELVNKYLVEMNEFYQYSTEAPELNSFEKTLTLYQDKIKELIDDVKENSLFLDGNYEFLILLMSFKLISEFPSFPKGNPFEILKGYRGKDSKVLKKLVCE